MESDKPDLSVAFEGPIAKRRLYGRAGRALSNLSSVKSILICRFLRNWLVLGGHKIPRFVEKTERNR